ncbi:MAG: hypothetical protein ACREPG_00575, partial [Candidatus Binatia bacterium]
MVRRHWSATQDVLDAVHERETKIEDLTPGDLRTSEPHVVQLLIDLIVHDTDNDTITLTDAERWHLLAVFNTVVETLHESAGLPRRLAAENN